MPAPRSPWSPDNPDVPNVVPDAPPSPAPDTEIAETDTRIQRDDLDPRCFTLVRAGEVVPAGIRHLPRFAVKSGTLITSWAHGANAA